MNWNFYFIKWIFGYSVVLFINTFFIICDSFFCSMGIVFFFHYEKWNLYLIFILAVQNMFIMVHFHDFQYSTCKIRFFVAGTLLSINMDRLKLYNFRLLWQSKSIKKRLWVIFQNVNTNLKYGFSNPTSTARWAVVKISY